jgi:hypothetical protein
MDMKEILAIAAENHGQRRQELEAEIESLYQIDGQNSEITADQFLRALTARLLILMKG